MQVKVFMHSAHTLPRYPLILHRNQQCWIRIIDADQDPGLPIFCSWNRFGSELLLTRIRIQESVFEEIHFTLITDPDPELTSYMDPDP